MNTRRLRATDLFLPAGTQSPAKNELHMSKVDYMGPGVNYGYATGNAIQPGACGESIRSAGNERPESTRDKKHDFHADDRSCSVELGEIGPFGLVRQIPRD